MRFALRTLGLIGPIGIVAGSLVWSPVTRAAGTPTPTFTKDVAPILYKNCAECHRPTSMAPMSLMTYDDVRPWARAVKQKVVARQMPPWGADPTVAKYANDVSLKQSDIDTIVAWVDGGAPQGNAADLPKAPEFADGWSIGKPDVVLRMQQPFAVPADGTVPYTYVTIPTNFATDVWIRGVELKPTDRRVVHHIISYVVEGNGMPADPKPSLTRDLTRKEVAGGLGGLVPGRLYGLYEDGVARKIPAGADIVLQMHYTTVGQPVIDQTEIGLVLSKEPPAKLRQEAGGAIPNTTFAIPPGDPNFAVTGQQKIDRDTYLSTMYPHMHVRGKDATYSIVYPDGREEVVLRVPKYDFNWQLSYKLAEPRLMPKGSILKVVMHYDNSSGNRFNPDPTATVRWGDQTWEEMMLGYYGTIELPGSTATRTRPSGAKR
ncbi:MAG: thiol-disulfide isomerase [Acidobacteriia bacterium]|nr:thiol-disulfide isomerase [Terriglobia bacterium]